MHSFVRVLAAAVLAPMLAIAVPVAASAERAPYPAGKPDTWSRTITPSTTLTHDVPAGVFDPGSPLEITVTSECAAPVVADFAAARVGGRLVSDSAGGAVLKLDFGARSCGVYDVTTAQSGSDRVSYGVVTVLAADPSLAQTGTDIDAAVLWAAAGVIMLGGGLWAVSWGRRRRDRRTQA